MILFRPPPEVGGGPRETGPGIDLITPSGAWAVEQLFESLEAWNPQLGSGFEPLPRLNPAPPPLLHETPFQAVYAGAAQATFLSQPAQAHLVRLEADPGQLRALTGLVASGSIGDTDRDGVGDAMEALARHAGDGNQDGIADRFQSSVASLRSAFGQMVTLDAGGHALRGVQAHAAPRDSNLNLPYGLFSFDIGNVTPGGPATLGMILPEDATPTAYFKTVSPLPFGGEGLGVRGLTRFGFDGTTGARIAGNVVTLHYVDGGRGDADGVANGVIVDPGGPGQYPPVVNAGPDTVIGIGQQVTVGQSFSDADGDDGPWTVQYVWGDGASETFQAVSQGALSRVHVYANEGTYNVTITVTDASGGVGQDVAQVQVVNVQWVEWLEFTPGQFDTNPPEIGGGKRIFSDKVQGDTPQQASNRKKVKLRAHVGAPNIDVYITVFDVDDPSTNHPDVDNELMPGDNRGGGGNSFQALRTNANGFVEIEWLVSMQPGDNYRAIATCDPVARNGAYAKQNDGTQARVFDSTHSPFPNAKVKVSDLLTVWRRLHVEVDSMGAVTGNTVTGFITNVRAGAQANTSILTTDQTLNDSMNRFVPGTLSQYLATFSVIANTNGPNFEVTVNNGTGLPPAIGAFNLVDDDFLVDGQDVPMPDTSTLDPAMNEAYVKVLFDVGDNNNNVPFDLNVEFGELLQRMDWDSWELNGPDFWVAYVLGAFQGPKNGDVDPNNEGGDAGQTIDPAGGSYIYLEVIRDRYGVNYAPWERDTVVHEVGHAVGRSGQHPVTEAEYTPPGTLSKYVPAYLNRIRSAINPFPY